jgi:hypothetical protein
VIKLNRYLKQITFLLIILIPFVSSGIGFSNTVQNQQPQLVSNTSSQDSIINPLFQVVPSAKYFDKSTFGNGTSINVSREILVNNWKYTTVTDKVVIKTNESEFNAFTYTLPKDVYQRVNNHIELKVESNNITTHELYSYPDMKNETVDIQFIIEDIKLGNETTITIVLGMNDFVSTDATNIEFPFEFSGMNFYPLFNFPITNYDYSGGIASYETNKSVNSDIFYPEPAKLGLTAEVDTNFNINTIKLIYSSMTSLPNFDYTTISADYPKIGSTNFIPAYSDNLTANFTENVEFRYNINKAPISFSKAKVEIEISEWGYINYREVVTLVNEGIEGQSIGGAGGTFIPIFINAKNLVSFSVYDDFANLTKSTRSAFVSSNEYPTNITYAKITPRSPILASSSYTYDLRYQIPASEYMNEKDGILSPAYNISLPAMSLFNWTNREVDLTITFPVMASVALPSTLWGHAVTSDNLVSTGLLGFGHPVLSMKLTNFSSLDNKFETINFNLPPVIGPFINIFENAFILFMIGLAIVIIRIAVQKVSHVVEISTTVETQIPFELMRDFVTAYEEKTALRSRLSDLEKKKKNLRKVEYEQRTQTLRNKQIANDKKLVGITSELVKVGPVYQESIRNLELAEAERDQILTQIADLDEKKKQSRIRPEIYNKLKSEQNSRLNKAITRIERVLNELRSLLREAR